MYTAKLKDKTIQFTIEGNEVLFNGQKVELERQMVEDNRNELNIYTENNSYKVFLLSLNLETKVVKLLVNNETIDVQIQDEFDTLLEDLGIDLNVSVGADQLLAPMPGKVLDILVSEGDEIEENTPLVILEAMKMENVLKSETAVKIKAIHIKKGDAVEKNASLISFDLD